MGSWDYGVMEGDDALDMLGILADCVGVEFCFEAGDEHITHHGFVFTRDIVNERIATLYEVSCCQEPYDPISGLVIGDLVMETGACMPNVLRVHILDCIADDPWSMTSDERKAELVKFRKLIEEYPALGRG